MNYFIESPKRKRPEEEKPEKSVFLIGLVLILGFGILMIPFGIFFTISTSTLALVLLFLPLLFLSLSFVRNTGLKIIFAVFLALLSGGTSILFLGDYIGFLAGINVRTNVLPEEVGVFSDYKYLYLKDFKIDESNSESFKAPILIRNRFGNKIYGPTFNFRYAKIVSVKDSILPRSVFAICYTSTSEPCQFSGSVSGGAVIQDPIWEPQSKMVPAGAIFLLWKDQGLEEFSKKGKFAILAYFCLIFLWAGVVFFPNWIQKLRKWET